MSLVLAIASGDHTIIASDTLISVGEDALDLDTEPKYWQVDDDVWIGCAGEGGTISAVRRSLRRGGFPPVPHVLDRGYLTEVAYLLRCAAKEHSDDVDFEAVLCVGGVPHIVTGGGDVWSSRCGYVCVGAGSSWAEGALAASEPAPGAPTPSANDVSLRARGAFDAADRHCNSVGGEFRCAWVRRGVGHQDGDGQRRAWLPGGG